MLEDFILWCFASICIHLSVNSPVPLQMLHSLSWKIPYQLYCVFKISWCLFSQGVIQCLLSQSHFLCIIVTEISFFIFSTISVKIIPIPALFCLQSFREHRSGIDATCFILLWEYGRFLQYNFVFFQKKIPGTCYIKHTVGMVTASHPRPSAMYSEL